MVLKEQHERVWVLRLANPPGNVLNMSLLHALRGEIIQADSEKDVRCLVLASAYPRYFSTGLDLVEVVSLPLERRHEMFEALFGVYFALRALSKPSLAAMGGSAILGGWIMAMGCDFRLLSEGTGRIALCEIRMGLSPGGVLIRRLCEIASNPVLVKEMVLRGRTLHAEEALAGGFVDRLVPAEAMDEESLKEARQLCKLPSQAYASIKRSLWPSQDDEALPARDAGGVSSASRRP